MFALTGETYRVEGVILSGGRRYLGWISKFTLYFSMDKENWELAPTDKVVSVCDQPIISEEGPVNLNTVYATSGLSFIYNSNQCQSSALLYETYGMWGKWTVLYTEI